MTRTRMPFPKLPPRQCLNPDCVRGKGGTRAIFTPKTPWQKDCCPVCRRRRNYLEIEVPRQQAALAARGGPKRRGRKPKAELGQTAQPSAPVEPEESCDSDQEKTNLP